MVDASKCPRCGEQNDCGVVRNKDSCWCMTANFPKEMLSENPTSCICANCLRKFNEQMENSL